MISEVDLWPLHAHMYVQLHTYTYTKTQHKNAPPEQPYFPDLMFPSFWLPGSSPHFSWPVKNSALPTKFLPARIHSWICNCTVHPVQTRVAGAIPIWWAYACLPLARSHK